MGASQLYNEEGVRAAAKGVVVVKSQDVAKQLIDAGVVATSLGNWRPHMAAAFEGHPAYIICEDNYSRCVNCAADLYPIATMVKIVSHDDFGDNLGDWLLATEGARKELGGLIKSADIWEPPSVSESRKSAEMLAAERLGYAIPEHDKPAARTPPPSPPIETSDDWKSMLIYSDDGSKLQANVNNAMVLLGYHPEVVGVFGYNEFTKRVDVLRRPPWQNEGSKYPRSLSDVDDTRATAWLERHGVKLNIGVVHNAIVSAAHHNPFHPLQEYLNGLVWDQEPRLTNALADFFGCDKNEYTQAVSRRFLIGAVARALDPGCG